MLELNSKVFLVEGKHALGPYCTLIHKFPCGEKFRFKMSRNPLC